MNTRPTTPSDLETIAKWIECEPDHKDRINPEFFQSQGECFAVLEGENPVMFVRLDRICRVHIEFIPNDRQKVAKYLDEFTTQIKANAKFNGFTQIIFESLSAPLIRFLAKRGFRKSPNEVVVDLC